MISAYLQEAGFAYCQDVAELLHVGKRKTAGILRRMVKDGRLLALGTPEELKRQAGCDRFEDAFIAMVREAGR